MSEDGAAPAFGNPMVDKMLRDMQQIESIAGMSVDASEDGSAVADPSSSGRRSRGPRDFSESLKIESEIRKSDKSKRKPRRNASMENLSKARLGGESSVPTSPLARMNLGSGDRANAGSLPSLDLVSGLDVIAAAAAEVAGEQGVPATLTSNEKKKKRPVRRNHSLPTSLSSLNAQSNFVLNPQATGASVQALQAMGVEDVASSVEAQVLKLDQTAVPPAAKPKKGLRRNTSLPTSLSGITVRSDMHSGLTPIIEGQRMGDAGLAGAPSEDAANEVAQLRSENEKLRQQLSQQAYLSSESLSVAMQSANQGGAAQFSAQSGARLVPHRMLSQSADAISSMSPEFAVAAHALGRSEGTDSGGHFTAGAIGQQQMQSSVDVRATVLSNMTKHRGFAHTGAEQDPSVPMAARKPAAVAPTAAAVALECKHYGCTAKLIIGENREKQVVGSHNHTLCQRGCWTCKNFVDAYFGRLQ